MKRILIVGATSAIAEACARLWAAEGASLFLAARDETKLRTVAADLRLRGAAAVGECRFDAEDLPSHAALVEAALRQLGHVDVALVAHGTLPDQPACEASAERTLREFGVNALSVIALLTLLANRLEAQRGGALAVITSVAGDRGRPTNYVYGSAKAAVSTFCEGLRARLFRAGVTVTDIRPGFVATPMTRGLPLPAALVAQPAAVARRIVRHIDRGADVVYAPAFWWLILFVVRHLPRFVFKRLRL